MAWWWTARERVGGGLTVRVAAWLIGVIGVFVPVRRRAEWRAEWLAELEAAAQRNGNGARLVVRSLESLPDALWLRRREGGGGPLRSDVRFAVRSMARSPGFAALVVVTLAVGLGSSTAMFSVVDGLLLRPIPFREPERLVELWFVRPGSTSGGPYVTSEVAEAWRSGLRLVEEVRAHSHRSVVLVGGDRPRGLGASLLEPGFLGMLGVQPALGRDFLPQEATPGRDHVVLLSHELWRDAFGADAGVVGTTVRLDGDPYTVVGVLPPALRVLPGGIVSLAVPLTSSTPGPGATGRILLLGRLATSVPLSAAQAELDVLATRLAAERPREQGWRGRLQPLENFAGTQRSTLLLVLSGGVLCLLLIASVNAAGLLLARGAARRQELAVRTALGAGRGGLVRLLLVESLMLACAAGLLGLVVAHGALRVMLATMPSTTLRFSYTTVGLDARVLAFGLLLTLLTGVAFGVGPALLVSREGTRLSRSTRASTATRAEGRARSAILVTQVALTMTLLAGAALMTRSFLRLLDVDPGFRADNLLVLWLDPSRGRYPTPEARLSFLEDVGREIAVLPGVVGVSRSDGVPPYTGFMAGLSLEAEGGGGPLQNQPELLPQARVDTGYFAVIGIPILEGRPFLPEDAARASELAIIDVDLARFLWPEGGAVGRRFRTSADAPWLTVVGVAGDAKLMGPDDRTHPFELYSPAPLASNDAGADHPAANRFFAIATGPPPATLAPAVRDVVSRLDPEQPIEQLATAEARLADTIAQERFALLLMTAFGAIALLLSLIGIHGAVSHAVARRRREIGIRVALGATGRAIARDVFGRGMAPILIGAVLGVACALALSRYVASLLFETDTNDPGALTAAAALLLAGGAAALTVPMLRARRVDPGEALRVE